MLEHSALFTDLYQLTMLQAYYAERMTAPAVFELFFRKFPKQRNYVMAAGLNDALDFLENLRFSENELEWLRKNHPFKEEFLDRLREFRFTGDVYAVAEGTLVFENEPVLQVIAPLPEAQLVETYLLNQFHLQSLAATKAARVVTAAQGRKVVDFGSRRAHGTDAALKVARCSYLAGAAGTSNVLAHQRYGVPAFGTMAHSYIQAHTDEKSAFEAFIREFPGSTLLVDTYDTPAGVSQVIDLVHRHGNDFPVRAVRLDSGDLAVLSRQTRRMLDEAGLHTVQIIVSSSLNEYKIAELLEASAPIDGFGVGTELAVSGDAPDIDFAYKLVEYDAMPRIKLSSSKVLLAGRKQIFREVEADRMHHDTICRFDEKAQGEALLQPVMRNGQRLTESRVSLDQARQHAQAELASLPTELHALQRVENGYPVVISKALSALNAELRQELTAGQ